MKIDLKQIAREVSGHLGGRILPTNIKELSVSKEFSPKRSRHFIAKRKAGEAYHLTVGEGLAEILPRMEGFHKSFPLLSVRPAGLVGDGEYDILLQEHFEGEPLSALVESGKAGIEEANEVLLKLHSALAKGIRKSTKKAAAQEWEAFTMELLACEVFTKIDRALLEGTILPILQEQLLADLKDKRWTNGDLAASNIMVDPGGEIRVIDCEFAKETHFYYEDWIRLGIFSPPPILHTPAYSHIRREIPPCFEAYFWLNQILLANQAFPSSKARQLASGYLEQGYGVIHRLGLVLESPSLLLGGLKEACDVVRAQLTHEQAENARPSLADPGHVKKLVDLFSPHVEGPLGQVLQNLQGLESRVGESLSSLSRAFSDQLAPLAGLPGTPLDAIQSLEATKAVLTQQLADTGQSVRDCNDSVHKALHESGKSLLDAILVQGGSIRGAVQHSTGLLQQEIQSKSNAIQGGITKLIASGREQLEQNLAGQVEETTGRLGQSLDGLKTSLQHGMDSLEDTVSRQDRKMDEHAGQLQEAMGQHHSVLESLGRQYSGLEKQLGAAMGMLHHLFSTYPAGDPALETHLALRKELLALVGSQYQQALDTLDTLRDGPQPTGVNLEGLATALLDRLSGDIQAARQAIVQLEDGMEEVLTQNQGLQAELAMVRHQLHLYIDKVHRMQASFSWRATSLFRSLRRLFLDQQTTPGQDEAVPPQSPPPDPYQVWMQDIEAHQPPPQEPESRPCISILMPVYKPDLGLFTQAVQSVQAQGYANWELCIADDCSGDLALQELIAEFTRQDHRIKAVEMEKNAHISATTNAAFKLSSGEYIAFMDHDDLLARDALAHVVASIGEHGEAKLLYSDEDKISVEGVRHSPHFKTRWNPQLLLSQNYLCHFVVIQRSVFQDVGYLRVGYEGSQDWDLLLRVMDAVEPRDIVHIPKVLYHWRESPSSTAASPEAKPYTVQAAEKALQDYYKRNNIQATVELHPSGYFLAHHHLGQEDPTLTILIPTRNGGKVLRRCLESLYRHESGLHYDILVIDNGSDEKETLDLLAEYTRQHKNFQVLRDESPFNYSLLNNRAVESVSTDLVLLLNDDTEILTPDWLAKLKAHAMRPEVGAVGVKLLYPDDSIQHAGVILGVGGVAGHGFKRLPKDTTKQFNRANLPHFVSAVTAAFLCIRRETYQEAGGLDGENLRVAFNDIDFCLKVRERGFNNLYHPDIVAYHYESYSRGMEDTPEKKARFEKEVHYMRDRWGDLLDDDPYFSPNLSLRSEQFDIRTDTAVGLATGQP